MPTDATGAPTSLGIRKFNTSADAPSGLGFNGAMDDIDALLVARIPKSLLTTTGDIVYASGVSTPARLGIGSTGQVLTVAGGLPTWAAAAGVSDLGYAELTAATTNIVSTTEATGTSLVSATFTSDGTPVWVEFFAPATQSVQVAGGFSIFSLFDGATQLGRIAHVVTPQAAQMVVPVYGRRKVVAPSAGSHIYSITAFVSATTGTPAVLAGTGSGAGAYAPAFIRIWKA